MLNRQGDYRYQAKLIESGFNSGTFSLCELKQGSNGKWTETPFAEVSGGPVIVGPNRSFLVGFTICTSRIPSFDHWTINIYGREYFRRAMKDIKVDPYVTPVRFEDGKLIFEAYRSDFDFSEPARYGELSIEGITPGFKATSSTVSRYLEQCSVQSLQPRPDPADAIQPRHRCGGSLYEGNVRRGDVGGGDGKRAKGLQQGLAGKTAKQDRGYSDDTIPTGEHQQVGDGRKGMRPSSKAN
ncbi:MAG: hypothetical protein R2688_08715 [Fimbriimonadaceae bacterium]